MTPLLETRGLGKAYGPFRALENVTMTVNEQELVSVVGPNGAGKTTLVNLLTGQRSEMLPTFATHEHLRALSGAVNAADRKTLKLGAAESVKRVRLLKAEEPIDWFDDKMQGVEEIRALIEFKTTWHPVGA